MIDAQSLPVWDLSQYYASPQDPAIQSDLLEAQNLVSDFVTKYKGKVATLRAKDVFQAFKDEEKIIEKLNKPGYYLHLAYEAGGEDVDQIGQAMIQINEQAIQIGNQTAFFEVELSRRPDLKELSAQTELAEYSYLLYKLAENAKFILSEEVEQVLSLKELTSDAAWSKLYTDMKAKVALESDLEGETKVYGTADLQNLQHSPDRRLRAGAWNLLSEALSKNEEIVVEAYNNIMLDKKIMDGLRGYQYPQERRLLSNQWTQPTVDALLDTITDRLPLLRRYYKLKADILGLDKLEYYDVYAELEFPDLAEKEYGWEDCRQIIEDNFTKFHPEFGRIAKLAFEQDWIHAAPRPRKYGGAFESQFVPGFHPVVLVNFKGKFSDVLTVAHELGHAIHSYLTLEKQNLHNSDYTMSMAEIASLCCETVTFDNLMQNLDDPRLKLKLLCGKIDDEAANIFTAAIGRYNFESKTHRLFREQGPLNSNQLRQIWQQEHYLDLYGNGFNLTPGSEFTWMIVAHFTYDFYNYVYASGLLTSSTIYHELEIHPEKKAAYLEALEAGASDSPRNILLKLGLDIEREDFWNKGFEIFESRIVQAEAEWAKIRAQP